MILTAPADAFEGVREIPLDELVPFANNPRSDLGDLDGLAASIDAVGIIEPLVVAANGPHGYTVVAGHRRLAAAKQAGLTTVPCIHRGFRSTADMIELTAIENLQRADLSPLDEARAMQALVDLGRTQRDIAERVGCNQSHVSRRLTLLELEQPDLDRLRAGTITVREAEQIARPPAPPAVDPILPPAGNLTPPRPKPQPKPEPTGKPEYVPPAVPLRPTIASERHEQYVAQCANCGTLVCVSGTSDGRTTCIVANLGACPACRSRSGWWQQRLPVGMFGEPDEPDEISPDAAEVQADLVPDPVIQVSSPKLGIPAPPNSDFAASDEVGKLETDQVAAAPTDECDIAGGDSTTDVALRERSRIDADAEAERIHGDVAFESPEKLQRSPWQGYLAAKEAKVVERIGRQKDPELLRHVVAYEWGCKQAPRRPAVLAAALARLAELREAGE